MHSLAIVHAGHTMAMTCRSKLNNRTKAGGDTSTSAIVRLTRATVIIPKSFNFMSDACPPTQPDHDQGVELEATQPDQDQEIELKRLK